MATEQVHDVLVSQMNARVYKVYVYSDWVIRPGACFK
jgi:hypothetical protein